MDKEFQIQLVKETATRLQNDGNKHAAVVLLVLASMMCIDKESELIEPALEANKKALSER